MCVFWNEAREKDNDNNKRQQQVIEDPNVVNDIML
jgi:hypothetical protein